MVVLLEAAAVAVAAAAAAVSAAASAAAGAAEGGATEDDLHLRDVLRLRLTPLGAGLEGAVAVSFCWAVP